MDYRYIAVFQIIGVTWPASRTEETLLEFPALRAKVLLVKELDDRLFELDRAAVVGLQMLRGLVGQKKYKEGAPIDYLEEELKELRKKRKSEFGSGVFLVFEGQGETTDWSPQQERDLDDFAIAIEALDKKPLAKPFKPTVDGLLSAFALASDSICGFQKVTDGTYFLGNDNKPRYSYTFEASGKMVVSTGLNPEVTDYVTRFAPKLAKHQELRDSARLLARAMDEKNDPLMSFLSIWNALEIFLGKVFGEYEKTSLETLGTLPPAFTARLRNVMGGKYRLTDRFQLVAHSLAPKDFDEDSKKFASVKAERDHLMHGSDIDIHLLPVHEAGLLLRKYLKLHVERI